MVKIVGDHFVVDPHADKRGRLLNQPPRTLAASATLALYKCLMPQNVCIFSDLWGGGGVHKLSCSRNSVFHIINWCNSVLFHMPWSYLLTLTLVEGSLLQKYLKSAYSWRIMVFRGGGIMKCWVGNKRVRKSLQKTQEDPRCLFWES
jgi:hypothetical protein